MANLLKLFVVVPFLALIFSSMAESRPNPKTSLATRLKVDGETPDCWGSLYKLQACTGEVIMFFLNGETYLGPNCCQAIRIIEHECWPTLLDSLGYTTEEGNILEAYCDATIDTLTTSPLPIKQKVEPKSLAPGKA